MTPALMQPHTQDTSPRVTSLTCHMPARGNPDGPSRDGAGALHHTAGAVGNPRQLVIQQKSFGVLLGTTHGFSSVMIHTNLVVGFYQERKTDIDISDAELLSPSRTKPSLRLTGRLWFVVETGKVSWLLQVRLTLHQHETDLQELKPGRCFKSGKPVLARGPRSARLGAL